MPNIYARVYVFCPGLEKPGELPAALQCLPAAIQPYPVPPQMGNSRPRDGHGLWGDGGPRREGKKRGGETDNLNYVGDN